MVTDIAPTLLDWVDAPDAPDDSVQMTGRSLLPVIRGDVESVYGPDDIRAIEVSGNTALYKGDYKITRSMPPVGDGAWRLFNMVTDPGETKDIREEAPDVFTDLLASYETYAQDVGVLEMPEGYHSLEQVLENTQKRMRARYGWILVLAGMVFLALLYGLYRGARWVWTRRDV